MSASGGTTTKIDKLIVSIQKEATVNYNTEGEADEINKLHKHCHMAEDECHREDYGTSGYTSTVTWQKRNVRSGLRTNNENK